MLRILRKPTAAIAKINGSDSPAVIDEDLSAWELINASQSDDEDLYSFDIFADGDGEICGKIEAIQVKEEDSSDKSPAQFIDSIAAADDVVAPVLPPPVTVTSVINHRYDEDDSVRADSFYEDLMPWDLERKLGGERMKKMAKMGKKAGQKYIKTKRLPCYYKVKPGSLF